VLSGILKTLIEVGSLIPLVDFGEMNFINATVTTSEGQTLGVEGATILDIMQTIKF
jgi:hypothetical protein